MITRPRDLEHAARLQLSPAHVAEGPLSGEGPKPAGPGGATPQESTPEEARADKEPLRVAGSVRALILEHGEHEGPGLLADAMHVRRATIDRRRLHRGEPLPESLTGYNVIIALGGTMSAWDDLRFPFLAAEAALLAKGARGGVATLGVCLGAQLLARGLGARVYAGPQPELGIGPITLSEAGKSDRLLGPLDGKEVLHWHADTFDLPDGAQLLASSERYANQAFRFGAKCYGVQFHVECDIAQRRQWAKSGEKELRAAGVQPTTLTAFSTNALDDRGRVFASAFLRLA
jgi:GMP synthase (glutamine-hydrolysing)